MVWTPNFNVSDSGLSISEKIFARVCGRRVSPGEYVSVKPDIVASYTGITYFPAIAVDDVGATPGLKQVGRTEILIPEKNVVFFDHMYPPTSSAEAANMDKIRSAAKRQGIKFYEGEGIGHQVAVESGLVKPGMMVIHFDGHISLLGVLGAYATSVSLDDLLQVNTTGETWLMAPENVKVTITGEMPKGTAARDVFHMMLKDIGPDGAANGVLEFQGPCVDHMGMDGRMVMCDLAVFTGAETGIMNPDKKTVEYLRERVSGEMSLVRSDPTAEYSKTLDYDVTGLEPLVAVPPDVFYIKPINEVQGIKIDQALVGTCASGKMEDLRAAASILKQQKVHEGVRMYVTPASKAIYAQAANEGLLEILAKAGALVTHSTCDTCYGKMGYLSANETCVASAPLNIPGRMGSSEAKIYLGSAAVVAASAVEGKLADPRRYYRS